MVSVDGPDLNKPVESETIDGDKKVGDFINSILLPKKVPKHYPPRKIVNSYEVN